MSFHVNGDVGLDIVLDAYEEALTNNNLLGTDHRWRVEHCGGCRGTSSSVQLIWASPSRSAHSNSSTGATFSTARCSPRDRLTVDAMGRCRACLRAHISFHNDGSVSPPIPLLNIQTAITRMTDSGQVRGAKSNHQPRRCSEG